MLFPDGTVTFFADDGRGNTTLIAAAPSGGPRTLLTGASAVSGIAVDAGIVFVPRVDELGRDNGIWGVPIDGSPSELVLPSISSSSSAAGRARVVATPDGQSVAASTVASDECGAVLQVRVTGGQPRDVAAGKPLGFDHTGKVIVHDDCGRGQIVRLRGEEEDAEPLVPPGIDYEGVLTPDGRTLALTESVVFPGQLVVLDLIKGETRSVSLVRGGWDFAPETNNRYIVLVRGTPTGSLVGMTYAIYDVEQGWLGFIKLEGLPRD